MTQAATEPIAPDTGREPSPPAGTRTVPPTISTGCPELDRAWATYAPIILGRSGILIPDTDEDLTWHAFLGDSIDMQGFRAAEFAGVDPLTRKALAFVPLKARGIGVPELAALWDLPAIRKHLTGRIADIPFAVTLDVLRSHGGATGSSLAEAFEHFPWRKFHWSARALLQNSAALKPLGYSFRNWLVHECERLSDGSFPPSDFRQSVKHAEAMTTLERALRSGLQRDFYMVGPAMSAYMLCDWQLWLWREGRTAVFANFKLDSFHEAFVKRFGRNVIPADEPGFARWWLGLYHDLPPRLANERMHLAGRRGQAGGPLVSRRWTMTTRCGYEIEDWDAAKGEMKRILGQTARLGLTIPCSELVGRNGAIHMEPDSHPLAHMLGEVSEEEDAAGLKPDPSCLAEPRDGRNGWLGLLESRRRRGGQTWAKLGARA